MTFRGNTVPVVYRRERAAPWGSGRAERRGAIYRGKGEGLLEGQQKRDRMGLEVEKASWTCWSDPGQNVTSAPSRPRTRRVPCAPAYLGQLDSSLLEGAGAGVMSADVAVLAPVTSVRALHARQTPGNGEKE